MQFDLFHMSKELIIVAMTYALVFFVTLLGQGAKPLRQDLTTNCLIAAAAIPTFILIMSNDILAFASGVVLFQIWCGFIPLFQKRKKVNAPLVAKNFITWGFFLLLMLAFVILSTHHQTQSTHFAALIHAALIPNSIARLGIFLAIFVLLSFLISPPFFKLHMDFFSIAPIAARIIFLVSVTISINAIIMRHQNQLAALMQTLPIIWYLVVCFLTYALLVLPLRALGQAEVQKGIYAILLSNAAIPLVLLLTAPTDPTSDNKFFYFYCINTALSCSGALFGISFWKHKARHQKSWEEYAGAGRKHPLVCLAWIGCLISIAGGPATLGFWLRISLFERAVTSQLYAMAILLLLHSIIVGVFIARLFVFMFAKHVHYEITQFHRPRYGYSTIATGLSVCGLGLLFQLFQ